jgi:hypothetical protein
LQPSNRRQRKRVAAPARVAETGLPWPARQRWWTGHPNTGDESTLEIFFGGDNPAAVMDVVEDSPERIVWRVVGGPADWDGTTSRSRSSGDPTTLLFTHSDWREANEVMHSCSTNWGAYLTSLRRAPRAASLARIRPAR